MWSSRGVRAAIATISEDAWTSIRYPEAVWDDEAGEWISDAQVAETGRSGGQLLPATDAAHGPARGSR